MIPGAHPKNQAAGSVVEMSETDWKKNCNWKNGGVQYRNCILNHIFFNIRTNYIYIYNVSIYIGIKNVHLTYLFYIRNNPHNHPGFFPSRGWWSLAPLLRVGQLVGRSSRSWCSRSMCWILARIHVAKDEEIWLWKFLEKFLAKCLQCFVCVYFAWWERVESLMIRVVHMQWSFFDMFELVHLLFSINFKSRFRLAKRKTQLAQINFFFVMGQTTLTFLRGPEMRPNFAADSDN